VRDLSGNESDDAVRVINVIPSGINVITLDNLISLYPNPTAGELHLRFGRTLKGNAEIAITDLAGRQIFSQPINTAKLGLEIDLSGLNDGMYLVNIKAEDRIYTQKIQVSK
jgi:hypothetical protein